MKKIPLSGGKAFALVDDEDYEGLSKHNWTFWKVREHGYAVCQYKDGEYWRSAYMHRMVMKAPSGVIVDHKNGSGLDNQKANLRFCSGAENSRNHRKGKGKNRYKGVSWQPDRKAFISIIRAGNKIYHLGRYAEEQHAALMYDFWALELHGEFANTNFNVVSKGGYDNGPVQSDTGTPAASGIVCARCGHLNLQAA